MKVTGRGQSDQGRCPRADQPGSAIWDKANVEGHFEVPRPGRDGQEVCADHARQGCRRRALSRRTPVTTAVVLRHRSFWSRTPRPWSPSRCRASTPSCSGTPTTTSRRRFVTNIATGKQVLLTEPGRWGQRLSVVDITLTKIRRAAGGHREVVDHAERQHRRRGPEDRRADEGTSTRPRSATSTRSSRSRRSSWRRRSPCTRTPRFSTILKVADRRRHRGRRAATPDAALPVLSIAAPFSRSARLPGRGR